MPVIPAAGNFLFNTVIVVDKMVSFCYIIRKLVLNNTLSPKGFYCLMKFDPCYISISISVSIYFILLTPMLYRIHPFLIFSFSSFI